MSTTTRTAFAEVVRHDPVDLAMACLLIECEENPDLDVGTAHDTFDRLAATVPADGTPAERLRTALGGFSGDDASFRQLDASLLSRVLRRRSGLPILLSVVWLEVARRAGVPAYGTSLPGRFVVGVGHPEGRHSLVDPFRGGRYVPEPAPLVAWDAVPTLQRVLTNVRRWADNRPERVRTRLWSTELGLMLPGHPPDLRRELGHCLARLGRDREAAEALERYATAADDHDPDLAERGQGRGPDGQGSTQLRQPATIRRFWLTA